MAFFKFRMPGQASATQAAAAAENAAAESAEVLRQRARHRLLGAAVLVTLAVIGFPLLFDTQPRTVSVDIAVEIPDKNKGRASPSPEQAPPAAAPIQTEATAPKLATDQGLGPKEEVVAPAGNAAKATAASTVAAVASAPVAKPEVPKAEVAKTDVAKTEVAKADAPKAEPAKPPATDAKDGAARFVVQVGAYADADKAREVRRKLEKAGLKTYTHVADTKEGKRTRVRLGPFASREEADKAADKAKQLEFTPAVLSL